MFRQVGRLWDILSITHQTIFNLCLHGQKPSPTELSEQLEKLGTTFVKFGQIMSARPDIVGPEYATELARLQDQNVPMDFETVREILEKELPTEFWSALRICHKPIGTGSIAQVHVAYYMDKKLAIKIRRPEAEEQLTTDIALIYHLVGITNLFKKFEVLNLNEQIVYLEECLKSQLSFSREIKNNEKFREYFKNCPDIGFPVIYSEYCTENLIVMEFVEGYRATEFDKFQDHNVLIAKRLTKAVSKMMFIDGFVHADLHPGNFLITSDQRIVFLDLGMVAEIQSDEMSIWLHIFKAIVCRNSDRAAELFYQYAPKVRDQNINFAEYQSEMSGVLKKLNKNLNEIALGKFLTDILKILSKYGVYVKSNYNMAILSVVLLEGYCRQLGIEMDVVRYLFPSLCEAFLECDDLPTPLR